VETDGGDEKPKRDPVPLILGVGWMTGLGEREEFQISNWKFQV